jgi:hypothetical protein
LRSGKVSNGVRDNLWLSLKPVCAAPGWPGH